MQRPDGAEAMETDVRFVLCFLLLLLASPVEGRIWYVEKDGSGEYTVIQDAVNVAAPGDTIQIGPGRYDDYTVFDNGVRVYDCFVNDNGKGLAYIGAGEETIIGPEQIYDFFETDSAGLWCAYAGMEHWIRDVLVEHVEFGIMISGSVDIQDAISRECWNGLKTYAELGGSVTRYSAQDCWDFGMGVSTTSRDLTIDSCEFLGNYVGLVVYMAASNITLANSHVQHNVSGGIQYSGNATGEIRDCVIAGSRYGVSVLSGAQIGVINCRIVPTEYEALHIINGGSRVSGSGNIIIANGDRPAIDLCNSHIVMSDSHILRSDGYAVKLDCTYSPDYQWDLDLRNNYWGTVEADSIAAWIWDGTDNPGLPVTVEYLPFHDHPVSAEHMSLGDVKRMFR